MKVEFLDAWLKKSCEDKATRLDDLAAAATMETVRHLPGSWEELKGDRKGQFACRLDKKLRLVIRPTEQPPLPNPMVPGLGRRTCRHCP